MAIDVLQEKIIKAKTQTVSDYAMNPMNDPIWVTGIHEAKQITPAPFGEGTRVERMAKFLGKRIDYILEVDSFIPHKLIVMKSVKSPFPMMVTYEFSEKEGGTLASIRVQGSSKGFYKFADFFMAPQVKRSLKKDLANLKRIMEKN